MGLESYQVPTASGFQSLNFVFVSVSVSILVRAQLRQSKGIEDGTHISYAYQRPLLHDFIPFLCAGNHPLIYSQHGNRQRFR